MNIKSTLCPVAFSTLLIFSSFALVPFIATSSHATGSEVSESTWNGMKCLNFKVNNRPSLLVVPDKALPGNPWIWRTEFFNAFPSADIALAKRGFHVGYIDMQNMYGSPDAMKLMDAYYSHVTRKYKLSPKPIMEGFSRGGLFAFNWAAAHPSQVSGIYVDAPVCDFRSWPGGKGKGKGSPQDWDRLCKIYKMTPEEAMKSKKAPIDNLAPLAKARIPIFAVVGDADDVVPVEENIGIVEKRYRQLGGFIQIIHKPGVGHHPHSLANPAAIVNFAFKATGHTPPTRIVCIGDSITFGHGAGPGERWSDRIQKELGDKYEVFNQGISARTMLNEGDNPYQKENLYTIAQQIQGDIILIALGTNDSKPHNWKHKTDFAKDYKAMIDTLRINNPRAKIYCLLAIPSYPENYGIRDSVIKREINPLIEKIAKDNKCRVIDLYSPMVGKGAFVPDKVHPNGLGHEIMAKTILAELKKLPKSK